MLSARGFEEVFNQQPRIVLDIDKNFSVIVKRYRHEVYVLIRSGSKYLKLPMDMFEAICNFQVSVAYCKGLFDRSTEVLCSFCGLQFVSELECLNHEESCPHRDPSF